MLVGGNELNVCICMWLKRPPITAKAHNWHVSSASIMLATSFMFRLVYIYIDNDKNHSVFGPVGTPSAAHIRNNTTESLALLLHKVQYVAFRADRTNRHRGTTQRCNMLKVNVVVLCSYLSHFWGSCWIKIHNDYCDADGNWDYGINCIFL